MSELRHDWRDTGRAAADLAVLGMLMSVAALPVVTAGAAFAAGSAAVHHHLEHDRWPGPAQCWRMFRRQVVPGLLTLVAAAVLAALVAADVRALRDGRVPGGAALLAVTTLAVAALAGYAGLALAAVGTGRPGAVRAAIRAGRPAAVAASAGVVAVAVALTLFLHPVLVPVLAGYTVFALHVVARTLGR